MQTRPHLTPGVPGWNKARTSVKCTKDVENFKPKDTAGEMETSTTSLENSQPLSQPDPGRTQPIQMYPETFRAKLFTTVRE